MMDRRRFLVTSLAGVLVTPLAVGAQQVGKMYRVGILSPGGVPDPSVATAPNLVPMALRAIGYVDGRNLAVQRRFADGNVDRLPRLARELVQLQADIFVAAGVEATQAAKDATTTIPIVMIVGIDPVARGWVASLARPGGNTGVTTVAETVLAGKRLELIREVVPGAARIAVLATSGPASIGQLREAQKGASALRVKLIAVEVQGTDYDRAFATMAAERADALLVLMSPIFTRDRSLIIERAAQYRLPTMYEWREHVEVGGLMSYGGSITDLSRRVAAYVDKILKGAKPAELPVEQPTKFELVINLTPPRPSASRSRRRCWGGRIRSSSEASGREAPAAAAEPKAANGPDTLSLLALEIQTGDRFAGQGFEWQVMPPPAAIHRCACG